MKPAYPYDSRLLETGGIYYYPITGSTNNVALRLAEKGAPQGTVVLADTQSAGRGRRGRPWHSIPGKGIYFSLLLRPPGISPAEAAPATLAAAASAARLLRALTGVQVLIKWPNDLLVCPKKVGGILTEARADRQELRYLVLGMGLNVSHQAEDFPAGLRESATSLYLESGQLFERTALLIDILKDLRRSLDLFFKEGFASFQPLWKELSATLGNEVKIAGPGEKVRGRAVDLDAEGALLVEDDCGQRHRIFCGELR